MTRGEQAEHNFREGYTCAQAVALAFCKDAGADEKTLLAATYPMGGGMGRMRLTCGAVTGGVTVLGLFFFDLPKGELYAIVQEYARRCREKNGSIICAELLTGAGIGAETSPVPEERGKEYYKKRPCPLLVTDAADILEAMLTERGRL